MRVDEYGVLVSEIWPDEGGGSWAGNRGDSLANTSRLALLDSTYDRNLLSQFFSPTGNLRHPSHDMPVDWQEIDIPTDQSLPCYLAVSQDLKDLMKARIKRDGWRTGNGDLVSPLYYSILNSSQRGIDLCLWAQLQIFKIPWRWSDSKRNLELSANSSADVLNWFHCLTFASPWVLKKVDANWVRAKIQSYFRNEPNVHWYLDLYDRAIDVILK